MVRYYGFLDYVKNTWGHCATPTKEKDMTMYCTYSLTYTDEQIAETMRQCLNETGYQLDPHGACGYRALQEGLREGEVGFFLETAHPAKFKQVVDDICGTDVEIPARLQAFMKGQKQSVPMTKDFAAFKQFLLKQ